MVSHSPQSSSETTRSSKAPWGAWFHPSGSQPPRMTEIESQEWPTLLGAWSQPSRWSLPWTYGGGGNEAKNLWKWWEYHGDVLVILWEDSFLGGQYITTMYDLGKFDHDFMSRRHGFSWCAWRKGNHPWNAVLLSGGFHLYPAQGPPLGDGWPYLHDFTCLDPAHFSRDWVCRCLQLLVFVEIWGRAIFVFFFWEKQGTWEENQECPLAIGQAIHT